MSLKQNERSIPRECYNLTNMNINTYNQLKELKLIELSKPLTKIEKNLIVNNCPKLEKIIVIDEIYRYLWGLESFVKQNDIKIELKFSLQKLFDTTDLKQFYACFPSAYIMYGYEDVSIDKFIYVNQQLDKMVEPLKNVELSPFEQFIYVFYITSHFRKYKDLEYYEDKSRSLFELFEPGNDLIVCGGFTKILVELCKRINIKTRRMNVCIYTIDEGSIQYDCQHCRNILRLTDAKYNIDGLYISDVTWNNILTKDLLTTLVLTPLESLSILNYRLGLGSYDILSAQNYDEFERYIYKDFRYNNAVDFNTTLNTVIYLFPELKILLADTTLAPFINEHVKISQEHYDLIMNDQKAMAILFNFIQDVCNKTIDGSTIIEAMVNLKRQMNPQMTNQELQAYKELIIKQNVEDYKIMFPQLVACKNNHEEIVLENIKNKFDRGKKR